jgi:hypothetical protein
MADLHCPATCEQVIAYLQQFDPKATVWIGGKPPKVDTEELTKTVPGGNS